MNDTISLFRPVPDPVYSCLSDSDKKFFLTVGYNFCMGLTVSSFLNLQVKYKEESPNG